MEFRSEAGSNDEVNDSHCACFVFAMLTRLALFCFASSQAASSIRWPQVALPSLVRTP